MISIWILLKYLTLIDLSNWPHKEASVKPCKNAEGCVIAYWSDVKHPF